jgi:tripartite-type tricarboxylate transporter receptor subunit TctC
VTKSIGQPIVVENRPGAGGTLGAAVAAKAAPDGYTILAGTNADQGVAPAVYKTLPYDPRKDFAPIGQVVSGTLILVVSSALGPKSVNDLIALAKERPKQLTFASYGYGTLTHLLIAELNRVSGAEITHIPYKGGPEALGDVVAGRVTMMLEFYTTAGPFIQAGKLRPLMVASARRHRALPEVPTASEVGLPTVAHLGWGGLPRSGQDAASHH